MIQKMIIKNFKCFHEFTMSNLAPITIIGGKNNVGKSTILEAVLVQHAMRTPNYFSFFMNLHNELFTQNTSPYMAWNHLFHNLNESDEFQIEYDRAILQKDKKNFDISHSAFTVSKIFDNAGFFQNDGVGSLLKQSYESTNLKRGYSSIHLDYNSKKYKFSGKCTIQNNTIQFHPDEQYMPTMPFLSGYSFPSWPFENTIISQNPTSASADVEWLSKTNLENEKRGLLIKTMQLFDPDTTSISPVIESGIASIYVTLKHNNLPEKHISMNHMGDGPNKVFHLLLSILNLPNGILLIDEIENGLHYELHEEILTILFKTALTMNCQIIMTTHSRDLVEAALTSMEKLGHINDICYQRVDITKDRAHKAYIFKGDELKLPFDANLEIR